MIKKKVIFICFIISILLIILITSGCSGCCGGGGSDAIADDDKDGDDEEEDEDGDVNNTIPAFDPCKIPPGIVVTSSILGDTKLCAYTLLSCTNNLVYTIKKGSIAVDNGEFPKNYLISGSFEIGKNETLTIDANGETKNC